MDSNWAGVGEAGEAQVHRSSIFKDLLESKGSSIGPCPFVWFESASGEIQCSIIEKLLQRCEDSITQRDQGEDPTGLT